jgi:hypothetical protein
LIVFCMSFILAAICLSLLTPPGTTWH